MISPERERLEKIITRKQGIAIKTDCGHKAQCVGFSRLRNPFWHLSEIQKDERDQTVGLKIKKETKK